MASVSKYPISPKGLQGGGIATWPRSRQPDEQVYPIDRNEHRGKIAILSAVLTFKGCWVYATFTLGLVGALLGWVPAGALAVLVGTLLFYLWRPAAAVVFIYCGYAAVRLVLRTAT